MNALSVKTQIALYSKTPKKILGQKHRKKEYKNSVFSYWKTSKIENGKKKDK